MFRRHGRRSTDPIVRVDAPREPLTLDELAEIRRLEAEIDAARPTRKSESLSVVLNDLFCEDYFAERLSMHDVITLAARIRAAHDDTKASTR